MKKTNHKGFTLIELLLVIAVIVALAVTVFVALNPATRLAQARDARRTSDVDAILTAAQEYVVDNSGALPPGVSTTVDTMIGTGSSPAYLVNTGGCNIPTSSTNFTASTTFAKYFAGAPMDPSTGTAANTFYAITESTTTGIITVKACAVEKQSQIWESR